MKTISLAHGNIALVDDEDHDLLSLIQWKEFRCRGGLIYARGRGRRGQLMHRLILRPAAGVTVDHIDGNPLNNQKFNLRLCTQAENSRNCRKSNRRRSSQFKGVVLDKRCPFRPFRARIRFQRRLYSIGYFATQEGAAWAYDREARKLFGAFARCNFPPPPALIYSDLLRRVA